MRRRGGRPVVPHRSLRWRITLAVTAVTAVLLVVVGVVVGLALRATLDRDQQSRLVDRAARADLLIARGTPPSRLTELLDGQGVRAERVTAAGVPVPDASAPDASPPGSSPPGPAPGPARGTGPDGAPAGRPAPLQEIRALPDGTRLRLSADPAEVDAVLARFRTVMITVGAAGVLLGAAALLAAVARSLRPLESMTEVARAITAGDRRRRLRPARSDTEIGRTAAAFDEMLDVLDEARARSDASARDARVAADEARRSEATTRGFLADAAHELRTPLAGTQALAETLLAETLLAEPDDDPDAREELVIALVRETARASTLVADMLDLARIEDGPVLDRHRFDLAALADERVERARAVAPEQSFEITGDAVVVDADPCRVGQILDNLLTNARRHTPPGGRITVTVAHEAGGESDGESDGESGGAATVVVHNTGRPVPEAERERIFDRLVRLDEARTRDAGGAGLGLPIARALARAHGGDVTCRAAPDGSAFVVRLPLAGGQED